MFKFGQAIDAIRKRKLRKMHSTFFFICVFSICSMSILVVGICQDRKSAMPSYFILSGGSESPWKPLYSFIFIIVLYSSVDECAHFYDSSYSDAVSSEFPEFGVPGVRSSEFGVPTEKHRVPRDFRFPISEYYPEYYRN